jgi:flagellar hook-associated protein 3 FlgL
MAESLTGVYDRIHYALQTQMRALTYLQEQATTGAKVNRTSDDPMAARDILAMKTDARSFEAYDTTISDVVSSLSFCSDALDTITSDITTAETETTKALGGLMSSDQRTISANTINELLEEIVSLANTQKTGNYLFAGSDTSSPAYTVERTNGKITAVHYTGSDDAREVEVAPGVTAPTTMVGKTTFGSSGRPSPIFATGGSGVSAGTGASTATGIVWLQVVTEGTGYKLSIDGGQSWTTADGSTNQAITSSDTGQVLYVNTSAITKEGTDLVQISGTVDIFNTLIGVRDAMLSGNATKVNKLQEQAGTLFTEARQNVVRSSTWTGSKINGLTSLQDMLTRMSANTNDRISQVQDADIAQLSVDLTKYETLYQTSLAVAARVLSKSLFDFLS